MEAFHVNLMFIFDFIYFVFFKTGLQLLRGYEASPHIHLPSTQGEEMMTEFDFLGELFLYNVFGGTSTHSFNKPSGCICQQSGTCKSIKGTQGPVDNSLTDYHFLKVLIYQCCIGMSYMIHYEED